MNSTTAPGRGSAYVGSRPRFAVLAVGASLAVAVLLAALRVEPQVWGDPGVWLSVAARLLDGDRLYVDVFDNKDPLFFYSYAAALWAGGVRGPFVLEVVWLGLGTAGMALALRSLRVGMPAMLAGALVFPFALTAAWYVPGATMVPALALAPIALWLSARGSSYAAGAVVVASMLLKLNLGLLVAAPVVALVAFDSGEKLRRRALETASGACAALLVAAVLMALRGELHPYLDTIAYNVHYSNAGIHDGGIRAHLEIVREFFAASGKWQLPGAEVAVVGLLVVIVVGWLRLGPDFRRVSAVTAAALAAAFVTLALTTIFTVHLQLLAYPASLGAATIVAATRGLWKPVGVLTAAVLVGFALWSSLKNEDLSHLTMRTWTTEPVSTPGAVLETTRETWFPPEESVTYTVFGRNTEDGHAAFVHGMDLRCRYFHQYPFYRDVQLQETLECARRERPMLILVTTSFYDPMPGRPSWEAFVAGTRRLLDARYELVAEQGMSEVWARR